MSPKSRKPDQLRGTRGYQMRPHQDGSPGYELLDEYSVVTPEGIDWGRLAWALAAGVAVLLLFLGALSVWGWATGGGITAHLTTCPVHFAGHALPSAEPSAPVH